MPEVNSFSEWSRRFYRNYRSGKIRVAHSLVKRFIGLWVGQNQEVRLRSGLKLQLDLSKGNQEGIFLDDGDADLSLVWAIRDLVPVGGVFIDCGANCCLMGLLARQYRHARVVLVEPHPRLAKSVEANIGLNGFSNECELIEAAVSDTSGETIFYEHSLHDGSHSIHQDLGWDPKGKLAPIGKVRCVTLQEVCEARKLAQIDFLKIDTEGKRLPGIERPGKISPAFLREADLCRN